MQESLVDLPDEKLVELALRQFEASFGCRPQREFEKVYRWKKTMPQYHVGHLDRVDRIESLAAKISGLELAGKSYRGVGIPACILSGFEAAERLFDFPVVKP
jgi:oxygen-dependent protoporphyrinogen oxidase